MSDEVVLPIPNLELPQAHFVLTQENLGHLHQDALKTLMAGIEKDGEQLRLKFYLSSLTRDNRQTWHHTTK